jgi:hypothetical protein
LLLFSNHEYALEDISDSHIVQEIDNHTDFFTSREEINMHGIPLLYQQSTFSWEEENHLEEEHVDYEATPSVELINSQVIIEVLKEEELSFRESLSENCFCFIEEFNSLNSFTYYYLYPNLFNDLTL